MKQKLEYELTGGDAPGRNHPGTGGSGSSSRDPWEGKMKVFCPLCGEEIPMNKFRSAVERHFDEVRRIFITAACMMCMFSGSIKVEEVNRSFYEGKVGPGLHEI